MRLQNIGDPVRSAAGLRQYRAATRVLCRWRTGMGFLIPIASPVDVLIERIRSGEDFLSWLARLKLVEPATGRRHIRIPGSPGKPDFPATARRRHFPAMWFL
jgi:hypothetical protein